MLAARRVLSSSSLRQTCSSGIVGIKPISHITPLNDNINVNQKTISAGNLSSSCWSSNIIVTTPRSFFSTTMKKSQNKSSSTPNNRFSKTQRIRPNLGESGFASMKLSPHVVGNLSQNDINEPSAIQRLVIPHLIRRWDPEQEKIYVPPTVAIQDYTGSGKTIAYAAPIMSHIDNYIDKKLIPPQVVSVLNRLRGITLDTPPLFQEPMTILDEKTRVQIIEYNEQDTFSTFDPSNSYEFDFEKNEDDIEGQYELTATGKRVFVPKDEILRRRRISILQEKLKKIFPAISPENLNPENPQSRLQAIIVVPTRELAVQIGNVFNSLCSKGAKIRKVHPTVITTCAGKVTRFMLNSLGVYIKTDPATEELDVAETDDKGRPLPKPLHPFVEFGKKHAFYRPDQADVRKEAIQREKQMISNAIELKERERSLNRLRDLIREAEEYGEDISQEDRDLYGMNSNDGNNDLAIREQRETMPSKYVDPLYTEMSYEYVHNASLAAQLGGAEGSQVEVELDRQPHVVVGTPETLSALLKSGALQLPSTSPDSLSNLKYLIFDEIDHLARSEDAPGHRAVLELLSVPNDQTVFVSASMTKDTSVLMGRLARRQQLFKSPINFMHATTSHMEHLPRPEGYTYKKDNIDMDMDMTDNVTQTTVTSSPVVNDVAVAVDGNDKNMGKDTKGFSNSFIDDDNDHILSSQELKKKKMLEAKKAAAAKKTDAAKNATTNGGTGRVGTSTSKKGNNVSVSNVPDESAEVLFLSTEDYKDSSLLDPSSLKRGKGFVDDAHAIPIAPFVKHYYIKLPSGVSKHSAMMDLICQLQVLPKKKGKYAPILHPITTQDGTTMDITQLTPQNDTIGNSKSRSSDDIQFASLSNLGSILENTKTYVNPYQKDTKSTVTSANYGDITLNQQNQGEEDSLFDQKNNRKKTTSTSVESISTMTNNNNIPTRAQDVCPGSILAFFTNSLPIQKLGLQMQLRDASLNVGMYTEFSNRHDRTDVLKGNTALDTILATETLSRGIDFKNLSMVLNVDVPRSTSVYLHRAGRVGRLGSPHRRKSVVVTLLEDPSTVQRRNTTQSVFGRPSVDDEIALKRHAKKLGIQVAPWPFKLPLKLHKSCVRDHSILMAEERKRVNLNERIRGRLDDIKNIKRQGGSVNLGARSTDGYTSPGKRTVHADKSDRKSQSMRSSLADSANWMSWDSGKKKWQ